MHNKMMARMALVSLPAVLILISCCTTDIAAFHLHAPTRHNELTTTTFRETTGNRRVSFEPLHVTAAASLSSFGGQESDVDVDVDVDGRKDDSSSSSSPDVQKLSPLSMTIDELTNVLGGKGRALMVWDCLRQGIDPILLFETILQQKHSDENNDNENNNINADMPMSMPTSMVALEGMSTYLQLGADHGCTTSVAQVLDLMPKKRRVAISQGLGQQSLETLQTAMQMDMSMLSETTPTRITLTPSSSSSSIEESIGRLTHISTSRDGTTKLLLKMALDGLEVETVIIPFFDRQSSTLCVS
jgi:hypothetical protein